jgi:hypothetical protein
MSKEDAPNYREVTRGRCSTCVNSYYEDDEDSNLTCNMYSFKIDNSFSHVCDSWEYDD